MAGSPADGAAPEAHPVEASPASSTPGPGPLSDPTQDPVIREEILRLRGSIDNVDAAIVYLLAERFKCTQRVGELKAQGGVAPADRSRESAQIARLSAIATESGLDPAFAEKFREFIVSEVIRHHERIAAEHGDVGVLDTYS